MRPAILPQGEGFVPCIMLVQMTRVLLTGATGYVGGRLLSQLEALGVGVRCLARRPDFVLARAKPGTEVLAGDVRDTEALARAMTGVTTCYFLVHSMSEGLRFAEEERLSAERFGSAARDAGVKRIIYLGGLAHGDDLSEHLRSRIEVGRTLAASGVPVIELRASIIIGSGSLSFEMVRSLVERLPVMITPRWVGTLAQPIAVEDVIAYLLAALDAPPEVQGVFEIGGAERVSYAQIMRAYADARGLRRLLIPVPVLTPRLSSLWLALITPLYARVGRELIEGVRNETVVRDPRALTSFPVRPRGIRAAIERALRNEDRDFAFTRWSDALSESGSATHRSFGSRIVDSRSVRVACSPEQAFAPIRRIGGERGWYFANSLWRVRGLLDRLVGGPGLRRGRRDPEGLVPGDALDFWRVEACEPGQRLRLAAEMRLPGRAWLQFDLEPDGDHTIIRQTALFDPLGLAGLIYWYALYPLHELVFGGMLRGIARRALHSVPRDRS
ncbi:MAG: SDR family oxidoreductase [Candidatus Eisenbacteria bacterium]